MTSTSESHAHSQVQISSTLVVEQESYETSTYPRVYPLSRVPEASQISGVKRDALSLPDCKVYKSHQVSQESSRVYLIMLRSALVCRNREVHIQRSPTHRGAGQGAHGQAGRPQIVVAHRHEAALLAGRVHAADFAVRLHKACFVCLVAALSIAKFGYAMQPRINKQHQCVQISPMRMLAILCLENVKTRALLKRCESHNVAGLIYAECAFIPQAGTNPPYTHRNILFCTCKVAVFYSTVFATHKCKTRAPHPLEVPREWNGNRTGDQTGLTSNSWCRSWSEHAADTLRTMRVREGVSLKGRSPIMGLIP